MIQLLTQADMVLSPCGRPQPPVGYRWVDLPYVLSFRYQLGQSQSLGVEPGGVLTFSPATTLAQGTAVTINITSPSPTINQPFSLTVAGNVITISAATDNTGSNTTLCSDVVTAIEGSAAASALVVVSTNTPASGTAFGTAVVIAGTAVGTGTSASRIENKARVPFLCRGVSITGGTGSAFRIWWPTGRNLEQMVASANYQQSGSGMRTLMPEVLIPPSGKITIEITPDPDAAGTAVYFYFWGVLRYLLKADGTEPPPYRPDVSRAPRITGSQNQNLMAPEWRLGNQCTPETPAGYVDEPFTLYSPAVANPVGDTTVGVVVQVPDDCESFIIRNIQYDSVDDDTVTGGAAAIQIRLPSGYSLTNGDYLPADWNGPIFTPLAVSGGGRIIMDVSDLDATGTGNITTTVQYDGVKRIRVQ